MSLIQADKGSFLMMVLFISLLAVFFALNMGGSSFAASFATPFGGNMVRKGVAGLLFMVFVVLGAAALGENVSNTLGRNLVPAEILNNRGLMVIFFCAGLSMFTANMMKIPQSTSLVTVAAISGVGVAHGGLKIGTIYFMLPFWIILPVVSFVLTHALTRYIYPPRRVNYWVYERFLNHKDKLKFFVIAMACYNAFAAGSNNVANVAGPLINTAGGGHLRLLLWAFALIYGGGAFIFSGPIQTAGVKIVPLGVLTASIISFVSGTLVIIASVMGVPQSLVMLNMGAIFAVSTLKDGRDLTFNNVYTKRTLYTWAINPIITFFISLGLAKILI